MSSAQQGRGGLAMLNSEEARFLISAMKDVCTKQESHVALIPKVLFYQFLEGLALPTALSSA